MVVDLFVRVGAKDFHAYHKIEDVHEHEEAPGAVDGIEFGPHLGYDRHGVFVEHGEERGGEQANGQCIPCEEPNVEVVPRYIVGEVLHREHDKEGDDEQKPVKVKTVECIRLKSKKGNVVIGSVLVVQDGAFDVVGHDGCEQDEQESWDEVDQVEEPDR
ncbi:MAG: hypothetical protein EB101_10705 [Chitinophagia bacterium]|nr:hypothetical protein [Chitinophagia bacterium]